MWAKVPALRSKIILAFYENSDPENDDINILNSKRRAGLHEVHQWMEKTGKLNPHLSDLNRIFPGERILLPDNLQDSVSPNQVWQNVFSHIPAALAHPYHGQITIYPVQPGDTIDSIARRMFEGGRYHFMLHSAKRAVLLHNNPVLERHLTVKTLPTKMLVDVTPVRLSQMDQQFWKTQQTAIGIYLDQLDIRLLDFYENSGPENVITLSDMVAQLKASGAAVGMDDVVRVAGYGVGGVSGYASAGAMALAQANTLARELYEEAVAKLGRTVVTSKKTAHLAQMERFLKSHAKYKQLMQYLKELPRNLLPKGKLVPSTNALSTNAVARNFRKAYILPYDKWNSARYLSSAARQLNGKLGFFKTLGRHATWYIPATLGLINVADAPQGMKVRTMFEEGFSIVGGFLGTELGGWAGATLVAPAVAKLMTFCGLCLGPWGMVVIVAICAIATGWAMMQLFKKGGALSYDISERLGNGQTYHSINQLLESF